MTQAPPPIPSSLVGQSVEAQPTPAVQPMIQPPAPQAPLAAPQAPIDTPAPDVATAPKMAADQKAKAVNDASQPMPIAVPDRTGRVVTAEHEAPAMVLPQNLELTILPLRTEDKRSDGSIVLRVMARNMAALQNGRAEHMAHDNRVHYGMTGNVAIIPNMGTPFPADAEGNPVQFATQECYWVKDITFAPGI